MTEPRIRLSPRGTTLVTANEVQTRLHRRGVLVTHRDAVAIASILDSVGEPSTRDGVQRRLEAGWTIHDVEHEMQAFAGGRRFLAQP
jgi:hypothetical protein